MEHNTSTVGQPHLLADDVAEPSLDFRQCDLRRAPVSSVERPSGVATSRSCTQKSKTRISMTRL